MKSKMSRPDPKEIEELMKELQERSPKPEQPLPDTEFLNPWTLGKKKIRGRTSVGAKLPTRLPEL